MYLWTSYPASQFHTCKTRFVTTSEQYKGLLWRLEDCDCAVNNSGSWKKTQTYVHTEFCMSVAPLFITDKLGSIKISFRVKQGSIGNSLADRDAP